MAKKSPKKWVVELNMTKPGDNEMRYEIQLWNKLTPACVYHGIKHRTARQYFSNAVRDGRVPIWRGKTGVGIEVIIRQASGLFDETFSPDSMES
jgi:hypothetical protein